MHNLGMSCANVTLTVQKANCNKLNICSSDIFLITTLITKQTVNYLLQYN